MRNSEWRSHQKNSQTTRPRPVGHVSKIAGARPLGRTKERALAKDTCDDRKDSGGYEDPSRLTHDVREWYARSLTAQLTTPTRSERRRASKTSS